MDKNGSMFYVHQISSAVSVQNSFHQSYPVQGTSNNEVLIVILNSFMKQKHSFSDQPKTHLRIFSAFTYQFLGVSKNQLLIELCTYKAYIA